MRERRVNEFTGKESEDGKCAEDANQAGGNRGNGSRLGDGEGSPRVKKSTERPVGVANVHVFATGLRAHCA